MSYHTVDVNCTAGELSSRNGQLTLKTKDETKSLPIEDITSVILNGFDVSIHKQLLIQLGHSGAPLIVCENYKPVSILLPVYRSTDTLLTRKLATLSEKMKQALWNSIINAKCSNQLALSEHLLPDSEHTRRLSLSVKSRRTNKEAICAKHHWAVFREFTNVPNFSRERGTGELNPFLDYGYAVLLSLVIQRLLAFGLDPQFGFGHVTRERSAPLAYDVIEPFRPIVDYELAYLVAEFGEPPKDIGVFKEVMARALEKKYSYKKKSLDLSSLVEATCLSLRKAVLALNPNVFQPWTAKSSKWAG